MRNSDIGDIFDEDNHYLDYLDLSEANISEGYISSTYYYYGYDDDIPSIGKFILPNTLQKIGHLTRKAYVYSLTPYTIENLSDILYVPTSAKSAWKAAVQQYDGYNGIVLSSEPISVNVATEGTLQSTLGLSSWQYPNVDYLTISGKINSTDFNFLKNLTNLEILYISANIVDSKIPDYAFQNHKVLRKFSYSSGYGYTLDIGNCAFDGCENLSSFSTPYGTRIKTIGNFAFRNTKINSIYLYSNYHIDSDLDEDDNISSGVGSDALKSIGKNPFFGTPYGRKFSYIDFSPGGDYSDPSWYVGLFELKIYPETGFWQEPEVQQILSQDEKTLYATFTAESELTLCSNIVTIQDYGLSSIGSSTVILNSQLKTLGEAFLYKCANLTNIQISGNPYYKSDCGILYNVGKSILIKYPCAKEISTYRIPSSVMLIEDYAFEGASKLKSIRVENATPPTIFANTFEGIDKTSVKIYVPVGSKTAYEAANYWNEFNQIIETEDDDSSPAIDFADINVKAVCVGNWDINGDGELNENEAAAVTGIGEIFKGNNQIHSFDELQYFTDVTSIASNAFYNCRYLNSITFPNSVTSIGDYAFYYCSGLNSITIPNSVTTISERTFYYCSSLNSITIPNSVTSISERAFYGCSSLTSITIPNSVTSIGEYAFYGCSGLTSLTIPNSVTSIAYAAFSDCSRLTSVKVDIESPISISSYTFSNCRNATLIVPAGCKAAYQAANYWKEFKRIIEDIHGDVNGDEDVDVLDVVDIVRYTIGSPAETFVSILADINANGEVNVGDAVALVNEIAGDQNFVKPWRAPQQNFVADDVLTLTSTDNGMSLCMENERNYTAFQLDLYLPTGTDATDMLLNAQRKQGHLLIYNKVEEGHYRVAAISTSNHTFSGYEGELLAVGLEGIANEDICLRNIRFFTTDGEEHRFDDIVMQSGTTTDIASPQQPSNEEAQDIYDLQGRKMVNGKWLNGKSSKGIYIVNGKKIAF